MVDRNRSESGSGISNNTPYAEKHHIQMGCSEHGYERIQGFCKDCSCGICFRCAIGKHRSHMIVNTDEITNTILEPMIDTFDQKIQQLRDKASLLLDKAKSSETNAEKLPEI